MLAGLLCILGGGTLMLAALLFLTDPASAWVYVAIGALLSLAGWVRWRNSDSA